MSKECSPLGTKKVDNKKILGKGDPKLWGFNKKLGSPEGWWGSWSNRLFKKK